MIISSLHVILFLSLYICSLGQDHDSHSSAGHRHRPDTEPDFDLQPARRITLPPTPTTRNTHHHHHHHYHSEGDIILPDFNDKDGSSLDDDLHSGDGKQDDDDDYEYHHHETSTPYEEGKDSRESENHGKSHVHMDDETELNDDSRGATNEKFGKSEADRAHGFSTLLLSLGTIAVTLLMSYHR